MRDHCLTAVPQHWTTVRTALWSLSDVRVRFLVMTPVNLLSPSQLHVYRHPYHHNDHNHHQNGSSSLPPPPHSPPFLPSLILVSPLIPFFLLGSYCGCRNKSYLCWESTAAGSQNKLWLYSLGLAALLKSRTCNWTSVHWVGFSFDCAVSLRIADGPRPSAGRLEIFRDGFWYSVCSDGFDQQDTLVVCRQLGYPLWVLFLYDFTEEISLLKAFWSRWLKRSQYKFVIKAFILKCTLNCFIWNWTMIFIVFVLCASGSH